MVLLKLFVKSSSFLTRLSGRKVGDEGDNILVGGMPRSGNVFFSRLLRHYGVNVVRQHWHSPAVVATFPRSIFVYRRPSEVIPSLMIYHEISFIAAVLYYFLFILRVSLIRPVICIDFETLVNSEPVEIYSLVCEFYSLPAEARQVLGSDCLLSDIARSEADLDIVEERSSVPREGRSGRLSVIYFKYGRCLDYLDVLARRWMRRRSVPLGGSGLSL